MKIRIETHTIEKINGEIRKKRMMKYVNETHENYENRKMREYCKTNAIKNTNGGRKIVYYPVNRGKYTIEWKRENWVEFDMPKENKIEMKNKIVLIYENEMGIVELARNVKQIEKDKYMIELQKLRDDIIIGKRKNELNLPDKIMIDKKIYNSSEIWELLTKNKVEIFELC